MARIPKDVRRLLDQLPDGWTYAQTKGCHIRVMNPAGRTVATSAGSSGDKRAILNFRAELRRAGVQVS